MADKNCFMVGPIGSAGSEVRKKADWVLFGIVKPVLEDLGYKVIRADQKADPGLITNDVINSIFSADLVVADLTGFNPNVFYELGVAHAQQKPVISVIAEQAMLPFDNANQRALFIDLSDIHALQAAKESLRDFVATVDAEGYVVSNPVTHAVGVNKLQTSGDDRDQLVADLQSKVNALMEIIPLLRSEVAAARTSSSFYRSASNALANAATDEELAVRKAILGSKLNSFMEDFQGGKVG